MGRAPTGMHAPRSQSRIADMISGEDRGRRWGWSLGWFGSFLWIFALSGVWFVHGRTDLGGQGLAVGLLALYAIRHFAPWRHPDTKYWRLLLPLYGLLGLAMLVVAQDPEAHLPALSLVPALCSGLLVPMLILGRRSWNEPRF